MSVKGVACHRGGSAGPAYEPLANWLEIEAEREQLAREAADQHLDDLRQYHQPLSHVRAKTKERRGDLARLIYRKIEGRYETIFGDNITSIEEHGNSAHVAFERTPPRRFDLVIGADGLHSVVCRLTFGNQGQFEKYLGYTVAAFEIKGYP